MCDDVKGVAKDLQNAAYGAQKHRGALAVSSSSSGPCVLMQVNERPRCHHFPARYAKSMGSIRVEEGFRL